MVYAFNRLHPYYLNIIKSFSTEHRVGLLLSDEQKFYDKNDRRAFEKNKKTEKKFRKLCDKLGSERIYVNEKCQCKLLIIHHYAAYTDDYISKLEANFQYSKIIGMFYLLGTIGGIEVLKRWGVNKFIAPAKFILDIRKKTEKEFRIATDGLEIKEAGFPYRKYPIFKDSEFDIDYIIAFPSPIHFRAGNEDKLFRFLKTVRSVTRKIDKKKKIYIKYHSVLDEHRYFIRKLISSLFILKIIAAIANFCLAINSSKNFFNKLLYRLGASANYHILVSKYPNLEELTEYHNLGIELFLPHVRKGLITGNSGSVLHALVDELPVYNCDAQNDSPAFLHVNEPYRLPYCNGKLKFDKKEFLRVPDECRFTDLIEMIKEEIK